MSNSSRQLARVISRPVKQLQKPRPLKTTNASRHSTVDTTNLNVFDEIMVLAEAVANNISNGNFDRNLQSSIVSLSGLLKTYGQNLEVIFKDQLDRAFVIFRNGCRDENLDYTSRLHLLELIELRARHWTTTDGTSYYKHKYNHPDIDILSVSSADNCLNNTSVYQNAQVLNSVNSAISQTLLLGPGELVKSSGKFSTPTKIPGKNYCKDEVVIRNSDSGKVMGIKGRRVHMIEELSKTVISFERVSTGAKERLVQIIGPSEDKITYAKQLIEETIKRNESPVRSEIIDKEKHGSNSSLNSSASEDSIRYGSLNDSSKRTALLHSFSTSDATIGEYKYTVTIGEDTLKITGTNPNLVTIAKLVLDEYFLSEPTDNFEESGFEDGTSAFDVYPIDNKENTFKVYQSPAYLKPSPPKEMENVDFNAVKIAETEKVYSTESSTLSRDVNLEANVAHDINKKKAVRYSDEFTSTKTGMTIKSPIKAYSNEELIFFSDSPLSKRFPEEWDRIAKEFAAIVKKPPFVWFDSKTYMKERLQENDAVDLIKSIGDAGCPQTE